MPRYLISEPAEVILKTLGDALDLVEFGILLLNRDMRAYFVNRKFVELWQIPPAVLETGPTFRELLEHAAGKGWYATAEAARLGYIAEREAAVRGGSNPPALLDLTDGRHILFRCIACQNGGRILTYADISDELQETSDALTRLSAELRFNSETLEGQAAYLAALAEAAEDSAQRAEAARLLLENEITERRQLEVKLRRLATTDGLTGALNRSEFLALAQTEMEFGHELAVLMIDVDYFKQINDQFGHAGGDHALQNLVTTLRMGIRQIDLLGRLGGEEFAVLLPETSSNSAAIVAERLRERVAATRIAFGDRQIGITVSIGLAIRRETDRSIERILARADDALYRAKSDGRNRVGNARQPEAA